MNARKWVIAAVIITVLTGCAVWISPLFLSGVEVENVSSRDHPDWWRPTGGQNSQDSILERRSTVWNDNGVVAPMAPPANYTEVAWKGKFYTRGCRGMLEQLQIYCVRTAAGSLQLAYSPHPCLGPINTVAIVPGATWAWVAADIEEMWDYDSLFIWVYACSADVSWAYDAVQPYDGHWSQDTGATWEDMAIRPFIRVVYTGETPGDVPVSGIINNIPIPGVSSQQTQTLVGINVGVETTLVDIHGIGYIDAIEFTVAALASSDRTHLRVYCDENVAFDSTLTNWNALGYTASTPSFSLTAYAANGFCHMLITKRFDFRRRLRITAENALGVQIVGLVTSPTLLR